jgi:hypothetical protein
MPAPRHLSLLGLGALLMILVGNPFSAAAAAPELLPEPVGGIGQLMPPGAGSGRHVAVLAVWAVVGLAVLLVAEARGRVSSPRSHLTHAS